MTLKLYSIEQLPVAVPIWQAIMEDLSNPPPKRVARVLGLSTRTIYRYNQTGDAPRVVLLALFWLTRWGRSEVHTRATNDAIMACGYVAGLKREIDRLHIEYRAALEGSGVGVPSELSGPAGGGRD